MTERADRDALHAIYRRWLVDGNANEAALDLIDHHLDKTAIGPYHGARDLLAALDAITPHVEAIEKLSRHPLPPGVGKEEVTDAIAHHLRAIDEIANQENHT